MVWEEGLGQVWDDRGRENLPRVAGDEWRDRSMRAGSQPGMPRSGCSSYGDAWPGRSSSTANAGAGRQPARSHCCGRRTVPLSAGGALQRSRNRPLPPSPGRSSATSRSPQECRAHKKGWGGEKKRKSAGRDTRVSVSGRGPFPLPPSPAPVPFSLPPSGSFPLHGSPSLLCPNPKLGLLLIPFSRQRNPGLANWLP